MTKTFLYRFFFSVYQLIRAFRYSVLMTLFGAVSHCQQQPSCGTFFFQHYKKYGILNAIRHTTPRVITCGIVLKPGIKQVA